MIDDLRHLAKPEEFDYATCFWIGLIVCLLVI